MTGASASDPNTLCKISTPITSTLFSMSLDTPSLSTTSTTGHRLVLRISSCLLEAQLKLPSSTLGWQETGGGTSSRGTASRLLTAFNLEIWRAVDFLLSPFVYIPQFIEGHLYIFFHSSLPDLVRIHQDSVELFTTPIAASPNMPTRKTAPPVLSLHLYIIARTILRQSQQSPSSNQLYALTSLTEELRRSSQTCQTVA